MIPPILLQLRTIDNNVDEMDTKLIVVVGITGTQVHFQPPQITRF